MRRPGPLKRIVSTALNEPWRIGFLFARHFEQTYALEHEMPKSSPTATPNLLLVSIFRSRVLFRVHALS